MAVLSFGTATLGQGLENYGFVTGTNGSFYSPTFTELIPAGKDDYASALTDIGFSFVYDGVSYTQFSVNSNGNLRLGSTVISGTGYYLPLGNANYNGNTPKIVGVGKDMSTGAAGYVKTGLLGTSSNNAYVRVVEFLLHTSSSSSGTNYIQFQILLYQGSNEIRIVYGSDYTAVPSDYQIGLVNASASKFWHVNPSDQTATYSTDYLDDLYGVHPGSGRYYSFTPDPTKTAGAAASLPYYCDFENTTENGKWSFGNAIDRWCIASSTNNGGSKSLYVSNDGGTSNSYNSANQYIYAIRKLNLTSTGNYRVMFDWKCLGESGFDFLRAYLVPSSLSPNLAGRSQSTGNMNNIATSTTPTGWIAIDGGSALGAQSDWQTKSQTVSVSEAGTYYLVFFWRSDGSNQGGSYNPPAAVDNVSVRYLQPAASIPYTCNFENTTENGRWTLANGAQTNYWMIGTSTYSSSSRSLYVTNDGSSNAYTIASAASSVYAYRNLNFASTGTYKVSFKWKGVGESTCDYLRVFLVPTSVETLTPGNTNSISANSAAPSGWIAVDGGDRFNLQSEWQSETRSITVSTAGEYNLVFYWRNDNSLGTMPPVAVDDISVKYVTTPASLPYTCDFENSTENAKWALDNGTQTNYWMIGTSTYSSSSKSLYITNDGSSNSYNNGSTSSVYAYRNLNFSTGNYVVSFKWKGYGESIYDYLRAFLVPVSVETLNAGNSNGITTTNTPTNWIAVDGGSKLNVHSDWQISSQTVNVETSGEYNLVFYWKNDGNGGSQPPIAIDDIEVATPCTATATISVASPMTTSAVITRTSGSGVKYELLVSTSSNPETATETPVAITSTTYTATGLTPATQYYAYIRSYCSEYRHGPWSSAVAFRTLDNPTTIPYTCDFENTTENAKWALANGSQTNYWMIGTSTYSSSSKSLYITNDGSSNAYTVASAASSVYAYRNLNFNSAGNYVVSFKWKCYGESNYDFLRAFLVPVSVGTLTAGNANSITYNSAAPSGWIAVDGGSKLNLKSTWQISSQTVNVGTAGEYNLVFYWRNDGTSGSQPPIAIDDIEVAVPCADASTLSIVALDHESVTLSRTSGSGVKYEILVTTSSNPASATETPVEMTSETQTITGLSSETQYYAYIRSYCSEYRVGSWSSALGFVTDYAPFSLPYTQNFESGTADRWTITNGYTNGWYIGTATANGGNYSLYISKNDGASNEYNTSSQSYAYAYCKLNVDEASVIKVSFDWKCYGESSFDLLRAFMIPVSLNPTLSSSNGMYSWTNDAPSGWIDVSQVGGLLNGQSDWQSSSANFNIEDAGPYYLVFFWKNDGSAGSQPPAAVDNVRVEKLSNCFIVDNVSLDDYDKTSVSVSWNPNGTATQWQVLVSTSASSPTGTPVLVNSTSTTISNLNSGTDYYVYVRSYCSSSSQSPWSDAIHFRTFDRCMPVDDLSIDDYSSNSVSLSWESPDVDDINWQVVVTASDDPATETPVSVNTTSATISGLTPNTQYNAYVRTYCGDFGYSDWESVSFKTPPVSVELPYSVDFEGVFSSNWVFENGSNGWYSGHATSNGGSRSLYISNDRGTSNIYNTNITSASYAYFTFNLEQESVVNVSFDWKCAGYDRYDYLRALIVPASRMPSFAADETNGISYSSRPSGWFMVDNGQLNQSSSWNTLSKNITLDQGLYYVVFYWYNNDWSGNQPPAAIDNVSVSVVTTCIYNGYVYVSNVGKTSADISWDDSDDISQWEVLVTTADNPDNATETPILVEGTSTTVTNLMMETDYNVYVRAYCSESSKGLWRDNDFTTLPSCLPVNYVTYNTLGQTWAQLVWKNNDDDAMQWEVLVSLSDDLSNATESIVLANDTTVTINGLEPNTQYYAFVRTKCSESERSEWKRCSFTTYPPCLPPYDFNVVVSKTSARVMWYNVYNRLGTRLVLSETEKTDAQLADETYSNTTSRSYTFNSLTPGRTYHLYAATECGNGEHSDWVHFQFATPELVAMPLPYTQDFEDGIMTNWAINNNSTGWYWGKATAKDGESSLYISYDNGVSYSYYNRNSYHNYSYAYCRLNIDHQGVVRVKFDWMCYGRNYLDCMRAFLVPVSINPSFNAGNTNGMYVYSGYNGPTPNGWIDVADPVYMCNYYYPGSGSDWQTNIYDLNMVQTGDYYLVFFWIDQPADRRDPPAAIDNISVTYLTDCIFYGEINVDNVNKTSVDVSWSTIGPATQWQILATEADSPENATETPILVSSSPATVTGLNMNTHYNIYIRSYCSASDQGIWMRASDITTLPPCEPPLEISAVVNNNSVYLNWEQPYQYDNYNVYISQSEMTDAQLASAAYTTVTYNGYYQSGLSAGQTYHAYISSNCALGEMSEWTDYVFQTPATNLVTLPYYQDFDSEVIENWNFSNEVNGWYIGNAVALSGDKSIYISSDGGLSNSYIRSSSSSYAYCRFHIDVRTVVHVSFDWKSNGYTDYLTAYIVPASSYPSFSGSSIPSSWIPASGELSSYSTQWDYHTQDVEMSNAGDYYFVLHWENSSSYAYNPPAAVDDLAIVPLSKENDIISFTFAGMADAVIDTDNHTVTCSVPYSMDLTTVKPTVTVSDFATISPESNSYINLNSPFVYVVSSEDGTEQEWTVTATRLPVSSEAEILSFWTDGLISVDINSADATVDAVISRMYDIASVSPTFGISSLATINHTNGTAYDFSSPRQFAVTAEDHSVKFWTVNVSYGDSSIGTDCTNPYIVDAENDLPYSHSSSTAGMLNMYNTYNLEYPLVLEGNDAVYRIDLPYMMRLSINVSSTTEGYSVFVMNSCGTLASYIVDYSTDILSSETLTVDLPAGSSYVIIDTYGDDINYNIQITRISYCYAVDDLRATRLQNELDVSWSSYNIDDNWTLKYGLEGFDVDSEGTQVVVNDPNYAITGLSESTRYDIYVRANCSSSGASEWSHIATSTIASCQMPEDLAAVEVYDVEATLSWEGFNMTQWNVQYRKVGETQYSSLTVNEPFVTLSGLQISTEYEVRVRSVCGGSYSDFAELNITTECTIVREFPFVENFDGETFPPQCWSQERTAAGSGAGLGYANGAWMWATSASGENTTPKAMLADAKAGSVHNLSSIGMLFAQSFNGYDISLDVYRSTASEASSDEGVEIWVNTYPNIVNGTPQMLGYVSKNYQTESAGVAAEEEAGWYTYTFNARGLVGTCYVILVGKANNAGGVYVDNLKVEKTVDCLTPSNLIVESEDENSVVLAWADANAIQGTWTVRYSLDGGDVVETSVDEPQLNITGLQSGVTYNISAEIQGVCAAGMESDWYSADIYATTDCLPLDLPYSEDFNVADGNLPTCWKSTSIGRSVWVTRNSVAYVAPGNVQGNSHLNSPWFSFSDEYVYMLEFDVKLSALYVSTPDNLSVMFVTEDMFSNTLITTPIQNADENGMVRISVAVPPYYGVARFDFSLNGYRECSIDNVVIREMRGENDILTFEVPNQTYSEIDAENATVNVGVVYGTDLTDLAPEFTISDYATVNVQSGEPRDFTNLVEYVVTAENGLRKTWAINVSVDENSCPNPTVDDIAIDVAPDSLELTIAQIYNETGYNLKVSSQPIDPEIETGDIFDGVVGNVSSITGLHFHTYYYIYVQSNCGASGWTETGSSTICGAYELPYIQDFAAETDCWDIIDYNHDNRTWSIDNGEAMYSFSMMNQADDYLASPMLSIIRNAKLEFKYRVGNFSYPETFSVYVSNESETVMLDSLTVNNETYQTYGPVDLSGFAGQDVRIAIVCQSDPYMYRLYVDDFKVDVSDYVVDVSAVGRGTVTPDGMLEVAPGGSVDFAIVPDEYNELLSLTLDGEDVTADIVDGTYTISDVNAEHSLVATFTERYVVTASATEGGQIVTEGVTVVNRGESVSYVAIPDSDYRLGAIMVDGEAVDLEPGSYIYTLENIEADHTVVAVFESIIYHTVHIAAGANGTVNPSGDVSVIEGENLSIVVIPDDGYRVHAFVVDGENALDELVANGYVYNFVNVTANHNVHVSFVENTYYTIVATCGEHGTITPNGEVSVLSGEDQSFAIVADGGYHIASVMVDGVDVTAELSGGVYTFEEVGEAHTISAEFELNTYTVVAYAQGGTITPNGSIVVNHGDDITFEFAPDNEYELFNFMVDNQIVEAGDGVYVLDSVASDHVVVAVFVPMDIVRHEIVATAGENGRILPGGRVRVIDGENQNFQIVPDEHYHIASLSVDGMPIAVVDEYMFENVTENHTISATFEADKHIVTVIAGAHGSVTPSGEVLVDEGTSLTIEFDPNVGYAASEVLVDGVSVEFSGNSYTLGNVLEDHVVNVNFDLLPMWSVTSVVGAHGSIEPEGINYVLNGDDIEFTFEADEGYMLDRVVVDGHEVEVDGNTYRFENVTEDHYIYVSFRTFAYFITATVRAHGTITPSGVVELEPGASQVFVFNPYIGYELDSVFVDGEYVVTDGNTYEFADVDSNHTIEVTFRHIAVSVADEVAVSASLYPNPNDGRFMVDFAGISGDVVYQLVDASGAIVDVRDIYVDEGMTMEFYHDLKPGVYFARFISGDRVYVERFVVE